MIAAAGCTPFGGFDGEPTGVAPSGELLARGDSVAFVLTESGAHSSHPAFPAGPGLQRAPPRTHGP